MRTYIFYFLSILFCLPSFAQLRPGQSVSTDPLSQYQWSLAGHGQSIQRDFDDIYPDPDILFAKPETSLDWSPELDPTLAADAIVAIVDSGIDLEHEELQGKILLNPIECKDGKISLEPTGDLDHNGLDGDCAGWNFAELNPNRARFMDDRIGHGTHLAGIIAANTNNAIGIAGLSQHIKILPLKVFDESDSISSAKKKPIGQRVAEAINYAILRSVDVINLSLGWPIAGQTQELEAAIQKAIDQDIFVVAGAGNNSHDGFVFPCAMKQVVCVGSTDLNGQLSYFSNFGLQVDILAPGSDILSLWPTLLDFTDLGPKGYEVKSGTSQATPMVSAALALLKKYYPHKSHQEILNKLYASTVPLNTLPTRYGLLKWNRLFNNQYTHPAPAPVLKANELVLNTDGVAQWTLEVENIEGMNSTQIKAITARSDIELQLQSSNLKPNNTLVLSYTVQAKDRNANSIVPLQITIGQQKYSSYLRLLSENQNSLILKTQGEIQNLLEISNKFGWVEHYYEVKRQDDGTQFVSVYEPEQDCLKEIAQINIGREDLFSVAPVLVEDLDNDNRKDIVISSTTKNEKGQVMGLNLRRWTSQQDKIENFKFRYDSVIPDFYQFQIIGFGSTNTLLFEDTGLITPEDINHDPFDFEVNVNQKHFYYLQWVKNKDGKNIAIARTLDNGLFFKSLKKLLKVKAKDDLYILGLLDQNNTNRHEGFVEFLVSVGRGILSSYSIIQVRFDQSGELQLEKKEVSAEGLDLSQQTITQGLYVDQNGFDSASSLVGLYSRKVGREITFQPDHRGFNAHNFKVSLPTESLLGLLKGFSYSNGDWISFYETQTYLELRGHWNGEDIQDHQLIYRSSYIPGAVFSQLFRPFVLKDLRPGLLVDNSLIFGPFLQVWTISKISGELISPIKWSRRIPSGCEMKRPLKMGNDVYITLFCEQEIYLSQ